MCSHVHLFQAHVCDMLYVSLWLYLKPVVLVICNILHNIHMYNYIRVFHLFKAYGGHDTRKSILRGSATVVGYAIVRYAYGWYHQGGAIVCYVSCTDMYVCTCMHAYIFNIILIFHLVHSCV